MEIIKRSEKRKQKKEQGNQAAAILKIMKRYMPDFWEMVEGMEDPRNQSYITYNQKVMIAVVLLKSLTGLKSMNEMTDVFNTDEYIHNIGLMCGEKDLEEIPHMVTVNNYLSGLEPENLDRIRYEIVYGLIRCRAFENARFRKKWMVIVDGTRLCSFRKQNDRHCLHVTHKNKETGEEHTTWFHNVLEAKIILGEDLYVSIASEFIENEAEDAERQKNMNAEEIKQDCESKAFKRLAAKLKKQFPRLPVCILADGLYTTEPVFSICEENGWDYIIRLKEGAMPAAAGEFHELKDRDKKNQTKSKTIYKKEKQDIEIECGKTVKWVNEVAAEKRNLNFLELAETRTKRKKGETEWEESKGFLWVTNIRITKNNAEKIADAGRKRWKIENQGFNNQKNHRFHVTHVNSFDYTAMKNHYLIIQIADIIRQLFELRCFHDKGIKEKIKNISSRLLHEFSEPLAEEDILTTNQVMPDPVSL